MTGCAYGLGVGKNEIHESLECLEKKVFNTKRPRTSII